MARRIKVLRTFCLTPKEDALLARRAQERNMLPSKLVEKILERAFRDESRAAKGKRARSLWCPLPHSDARKSKEYLRIEKTPERALHNAKGKRTRFAGDKEFQRMMTAQAVHAQMEIRRLAGLLREAKQEAKRLEQFLPQAPKGGSHVGK